MKIIYKCRCMSRDAEVEVRDRRDDEDIIEWMETAVSPALGAYHIRNHPMCRATKSEYVKIPMPENAPFIGGKPRMDS
jgi:hypothetical protein